MKNFVQISTNFVLFRKNLNLNDIHNISSNKKRARRILLSLFKESYMLKKVDD